MKSDISPMFLTYHMLDWGKLTQSPSDQKCAECGGMMTVTVPVEDPKGVTYEGYVCHKDKRVLWLKKK